MYNHMRNVMLHIELINFPSASCYRIPNLAAAQRELQRTSLRFGAEIVQAWKASIGMKPELLEYKPKPARTFEADHTSSRPFMSKFLQKSNFDERKGPLQDIP